MLSITYLGLVLPVLLLSAASQGAAENPLDALLLATIVLWGPCVSYFERLQAERKLKAGQTLAAYCKAGVHQQSYCLYTSKCTQRKALEKATKEAEKLYREAAKRYNAEVQKNAWMLDDAYWTRSAVELGNVSSMHCETYEALTEELRQLDKEIIKLSAILAGRK